MAKIFTKLNIGDVTYSSGGKCFKRLMQKTPLADIWYEGDISTTNFRDIETVKLDDERILLVFRTTGSTYKTKAVVLKLGETLTIGTEVTLATDISNASASIYPDAVLLSNNKVLVTFETCSSSSSSPHKVAVLTIDDTNITVSTSITLSNANYAQSRLAVLTENTAMITYINSNGYLCGSVLTIGDTNITVGTEKSITYAHSGNNVSAVALTNSKVFIHNNNYYRSSSYSPYEARGHNRVLTVSEDTITSGSAVYDSFYIGGDNPLRLTDEKVFDVYLKYDSMYKLAARVVNINETTPTLCTETLCVNAKITRPSVIKINDNQALATYVNQSNSNYGYVIKLTADNDIVTAGDEIVFNELSTTACSSVLLANGKALVIYSDKNGTHYKTIQV